MRVLNFTSPTVPWPSLLPQKRQAAKLRKIIRKGHTHLDWICDVSWMNAYKCLQAAIRQLGAGFMKKAWTLTILRDELLNNLWESKLNASHGC